MADERGIEQTKELLDFIFSLIGAIKESTKDGEFTWSDGLNFIEPLKKIAPAIDDIEEVHDYISKKLEDFYGKRSKKIRILYGGSVNAKNVFSILSLNNVNGALIGGASLKIKDMKSILKQFI